MKKSILFLCFIVLLGTVSFIVECSAEKAQLQESIIRLHIVANSDSEEDQAQKLRVRDAVINYLAPMLNKIDSTDAAYDCIIHNIPQIKDVVTSQLRQEGSDMQVRVRVEDAYFDTRYYDTFALPAGVYSALRIELGEGAGKNWWCVAFPSLCVPAAGKDFDDVAAGAGFSDNLTNSLTQKKGFVVRFFFLDFLGRLENLFRK